ncbi:hypothetical protein [Mesorhizobium sp. M0051]|uniref:hypothetical protein n=1 Tax=Mesorhizobium sp. M0051 TaxID=2956862 RepID=UPI003336E5C5
MIAISSPMIRSSHISSQPIFQPRAGIDQRRGSGLDVQVVNIAKQQEPESWTAFQRSLERLRVDANRLTRHLNIAIVGCPVDAHDQGAGGHTFAADNTYLRIRFRSNFRHDRCDAAFEKVDALNGLGSRFQRSLQFKMSVVHVGLKEFEIGLAEAT